MGCFQRVYPSDGVNRRAALFNATALPVDTIQVLLEGLVDVLSLSDLEFLDDSPVPEFFLTLRVELN